MKNYGKSRWSALAALLLAGVLSAGTIVQAAETQESENEETQTAETENAGTQDGEGSAAGGTYAFISKSLDNPYNFAMADGFQEVIEAAGGECVINHPMNPYADDQITIIDSLISQQVDAIAIAANDETRLTESLNEAKEAGIQVITLDSDTDHTARATFCNQADTELIARAMMDAVYDIAGGEGEYAILSTTTYATNQNAWLDAMDEIAASDEKYSGLTLVDIAYGEDKADESAAKTQDLIEAHPDLKVICALTSAGITSAAKTLAEAGSSVKITGLGMPSEMKEYIGTGEDTPCPYVYLWNPVDLGRLAAGTCMSLVSGEITGQAGDTVTVDGVEGSPFEITAMPGDPQATEIVLGSMTCFTPDNIAEWTDVF